MADADMSARSTKVFACEFAHHRSRDEIMRTMNKGERISRIVRQLEGESAGAASIAMVDHPYYRAYFRCWNEQQYYEAHDVLEQVWLNRDSADNDFFKGLIQAAGAFVHLQKQFEHPKHPKHGKRLGPAVRLFRLAEKNLAPFGDRRHDLDLAEFRKMLARYRNGVESNGKNPWTPQTAPMVAPGGSRAPSRDA